MRAKTQGRVEGDSVSEKTEHEVCEECGTDTIENHGDETICSVCGLVIREDNIDYGAEWRSFTQEQKDSRCRVGAPTTLSLHDKGLTTVMGSIDTRSWSREKKDRMKRLREWDNRCRQDGKGRSLKYSLGEIQRICSELDLPRSIREDASKIFRDAHTMNLVEGRSLDGMASAAVFISCRRNQLSRTYKEIEKKSRRDFQDISRCVSKINQNMEEIEIPPPDPREFVSRFVRNLRYECDSRLQWGLIEKSTEHYVNLTCDKNLHSGYSPDSVVASALYIATKKSPGENLTQGMVAEACGVTQSAIRGMYRKQCEELRITV